MALCLKIKLFRLSVTPVSKNSPKDFYKSETCKCRK